MDSISPPMKELISHIDRANQLARSIGWEKTSYLLGIAWIDAVARANELSEEELQLFFFALESEVRITDHVSPPELRAAKRKRPGT